VPRVIVDDIAVDMAPGSNLLAAVRKAGHDIPALCYHPGCTPNTSCMACVVRLVETGRIVPACATPAEDGQRIESETDEIRALRRTALELLLSDHATACGLRSDGPCDCGKEEVCRLRKYALAYGANPRRFAATPRPSAPQHDHPEITFDPGKCILCGICVQLAEQAGESLGLTVVGRGSDTRIAVPFEESVAAALTRGGRRIAGACPTGALTPRRPPVRYPREGAPE